MKIGFLFNSLTTFVVFLSALFLAFFLIKKSGNKGHILCGYFWLMISFGWLFSSLRLFFAWQDKAAIDAAMFYINQFFIFTSMIPLLYYVLTELFAGKKNISIFAGFYGLVGSFGFGYLLWSGTAAKDITYFTTKYMLPSPTKYAFYFLVIPVLAGVIFLAGAKLKKFFKKEASFLDVVIPAAIFIFLFLGSVDELGAISGWPLSLFRLAYVVITLFTYIIFDREQTEKQFTFIEDDRKSSGN